MKRAYSEETLASVVWDSTGDITEVNEEEMIPSKEKTYIISDSLLKNLPALPDQFCHIWIPGGRVMDVSTRLKTLDNDDVVSTLFLLIGGNDLTQINETLSSTTLSCPHIDQENMPPVEEGSYSWENLFEDWEQLLLAIPHSVKKLIIINYPTRGGTNQRFYVRRPIRKINEKIVFYNTNLAKFLASQNFIETLHFVSLEDTRPAAPLQPIYHTPRKYLARDGRALNELGVYKLLALILINSL
jgi:hypothetical protein